MNVDQEFNPCLQPALDESAPFGGSTPRTGNISKTDNATKDIRNYRVTKIEDNIDRNPDKPKTSITTYEYFMIK